MSTTPRPDLMYSSLRPSLSAPHAVAPESFDDIEMMRALRGANTILVNAVMGLTPSGYDAGTVALVEHVAANLKASRGQGAFLSGGRETHLSFRRAESPSEFTRALPTAIGRKRHLKSIKAKCKAIRALS